jgi:uncharacterized BrkB/YihY/UPF0761 family membrane protein
LAYYTLLSLVPLLILVVIVLSHVLDTERVLATLAAYLDFVAPGAARGLMGELRTFLAHREAVGGLLLVTLVFFTGLHGARERDVGGVPPPGADPETSLPGVGRAAYLFVLLLGSGFLVVSVVSGALESLGHRGVDLFGVERSLEPVARLLFYLLGVIGEVAMLTAMYLVMPVGRLSLRHALFGGVTAELLWELTRHGLVWYYARVSQIQVVYGSERCPR